MAAHRKSVRFGGAMNSKNGRNSKNHQYMVHHFADSLDYCKVTLNRDLHGELPLMGELFAVKKLKYPSTAKIRDPAGGPAGSNSWQKQFIRGFDGRNLQTGHARCGRRLHRTEQHVGDGAFRMGARRYGLRSSRSHAVEESDGQGGWDIGMEGTFRVDHRKQKGNTGRFGFKDSSLGGENFLHGYTQNLRDDEFSLQHWMSFECIRNDASVSENWDHKYPTDARRVGRGDKLTRPRRIRSPSRGVIEVTNKECRKSIMKKKCLASSKNNKLSLQSRQLLSPLILNSYDDCFYAHDHHSPSFRHKGLIFAQQEHINEVKMSEPHKKHNLFQGVCKVQSSFSSPYTRRLGIGAAVKETWRIQNVPTSLSSTSQKTPLRGVPQGVEQSSSDDELAVLELPGNGCGKPCLRSYSKYQRKPLPDSLRKSFTWRLLNSSRNKCGPCTKVNARPQRDWTMQCIPEVQSVKKPEAVLLPTEQLATSKENETCGAYTSEKGPAGKLASDRVRWLRNMNCKVQEEDGLTTNIPPEGEQITVSVGKIRSLSEKYRPKMLKDLLGQNLVVNALSNAISKGKVAPVYLFQGSHGTGKTSAARIFAAALNCVTSGDKKPCGRCSECIALLSGKTSGIWELDAASHNGVGYLKELIQGTGSASSGPRYKIVIIDECHMFSHETWSALMKLLEEPSGNTVIILITTDPDKLPLTVVSRCQKFYFLRIKHSDIVNRLDAVMKLENLDAEPGALNLIASKSEGSLRDAETVLEQASLLGQRITLATIHRLVGSVPDDKLLSLLDSAFCSDTVNTVQRTRDLIDSGVDPLDLMSQLATLITDSLAGSSVPTYTNQNEGFLSMHALSDSEMERLRTALRILSESEKQLRAVYQYRTTWLTAALLQFGPSAPAKSEALDLNKSTIASPATQPILKIAKTNKQKSLRIGREGRKRSVSAGTVSEGETHGSKAFDEGIDLHFKIPSNLGRLWLNVLRCCSPRSLRQLLECHGKLLAVSFSAVDTVAHLLFEKPDHKLNAEMYRTSIANSFSKVLGLSVEVQISLGQVLCKEGFTSSPAAAADNESAMQSPCELRAGCEDEEPQGGKGILDFKLLQYLRRESEFSVQVTSKDFSLTHCSPAIFPQSRPTDKSLSNPLVLKGFTQPFCGSDAVMPEEHSSKNASIHDSKSCTPMQMPQNLRGSNKLQNETLKHRRRQRKTVYRPIAGLHGQKHSRDCVFASLKDNNNIQAYNLEEENLILVPQLKCGGLLCWRSQKAEDNRWKRPGISITFRPWIKSQ